MNLEDSWQIAILKEFPQIVQRVPIVFEWRNKGSIKEICEHYHCLEAAINKQA